MWVGEEAEPAFCVNGLGNTSSKHWRSTSVLTFKEISLNYGNLDLFKEIFKEMVFLRKF